MIQQATGHKHVSAQAPPVAALRQVPDLLPCDKASGRRPALRLWQGSGRADAPPVEELRSRLAFNAIVTDAGAVMPLGPDACEEAIRTKDKAFANQPAWGKIMEFRALINRRATWDQALDLAASL